MTKQSFWLYEWIDTYEIRDVEQARVILSDARARRGLQRRAADVPFTTENIPISDCPTIVAGQAVDLSGNLDCFAWECKKQQIDKLFSRVLHYFDRVVVVGPAAHLYATHLDVIDDTATIVERLLTDIRLLLYIREIGAEDLFLFRQKRPPCEEHLEKHLEEVGLDLHSMLPDRLIESVMWKADIDIEDGHDSLEYAFNHPDFEHTVWGGLARSNRRSKMQMVRDVTKSVLRRYLASLASDLYTSKVLRSPLGSSVQLHGQFLRGVNQRPDHNGIAFEMRLPILENVSPKVLVRIRQDEQEHFKKFRESLRLAINQRLANSSNLDAASIAHEIQNDLINPSLADIELRLSAARNALAKKAGLSVLIGGLATTCGVLTGNQFLVAAGSAPTVGYTISAGQKYIEEKRDISLSEMYFLWQVQNHSNSHTH